jgi:hypothetical protein
MHVGIKPFVNISLKHEYMHLGESTNRGIVWTITLVIILDYIQM